MITLGVLTIASEYGTGMIRTTLTACPSRGRVLTAKAIVFFLLVFVVTTVIPRSSALLQTSIAGPAAVAHRRGVAPGDASASASTSRCSACSRSPSAR